jgi:hypothetical protein
MLDQMRPAPGQQTLSGHATAFVRFELAAAQGQATVLGAFPTAVYLELTSRVVIAVLTSDAVALPIGIVLSIESRECPLDDLTGDAAVHADRAVRLGPLKVTVGAGRSARLDPVGQPLGVVVDRARDLLATHPTYHEVEDLSGRPVIQLVGRGPGLTPAGDDFLCGLLAGRVLFGGELDELCSVVTDELARRPAATTSLSRQLLLRACVGEGIDQVREFGRALVSEPTALEERAKALTKIGHTSGIALALGVIEAAEGFLG